MTATILPAWSNDQIQDGAELRRYNDTLLAALGRTNQARHILGWREIAHQNGAQIQVLWERRADEQVDGLPADVVDAARRAALAEEAAYYTMVEHYRAGMAWIQEHGPSDGRTHPMLAAAHQESLTAHRKAGEQAGRALAELGRVAELVAQARQALAAAPQRRQAAEQRYQAELDQVEASEQAARQQLAALGVL